MTFSEATDAAFVGPQSLIVLDRVQARLSLVQDGVARKSLRLKDSTSAALLLAAIRGDSVVVWDAFANSLTVIDGELTAVARSVSDLPAFQSVVGVLSDGVPVLVAPRPLGSSASDAYAADSAPLAAWDGRLRPLNASLPQWPTLRLQVGSSAAAIGPIWARRGHAQARGDALWIGDGARPQVTRINRNGSVSLLTFRVEARADNRAAELERRVAVLPAELRDSARALLESWAVDLQPPAFSSFRVDAHERIWVRQPTMAGRDSVLWVVHGSAPAPLAQATLPARWRLLDASTTHAAFAIAEPAGGDRLLLLPLIARPP